MSSYQQTRKGFEGFLIMIKMIKILTDHKDLFFGVIFQSQYIVDSLIHGQKSHYSIISIEKVPTYLSYKSWKAYDRWAAGEKSDAKSDAG